MTVLSFPSIKVSRIRRTLRTAVAGSVSPFTLREQVQDWGGEVWEYEFDVPPQEKRGGAALSAFFNQLGGKRGRFLFSDPAIANPAAAGSPVVDLSRRNLLTFTEAFDNAAWNKSQSSIVSNVAISPDGSPSADLAIASTTSANHLLSNSQSVNIISGQTYTGSIYVKASGYEWFRLTLGGGAGVFPSNFLFVNLLTGNIGLNSTGITNVTVSNALNGWWRISFSVVASASGIGSLVLYISESNSFTAFAGDGTSGVLIWGAQLEAGLLSQYQPILGTTFTQPTAGTNMLSTTGWTGPGRTAGEFFSIGTGADTRLYQLTRDAVPSPSGQADIHFIPRLRRQPVQGAPVEVNSPKALLRLAGPVPTDISTAQHYTFSIQAREAI